MAKKDTAASKKAVKKAAPKKDTAGKKAAAPGKKAATKKAAVPGKKTAIKKASDIPDTKKIPEPRKPRNPRNANQVIETGQKSSEDVPFNGVLPLLEMNATEFVQAMQDAKAPADLNRFWKILKEKLQQLPEDQKTRAYNEFVAFLPELNEVIAAFTDTVITGLGRLPFTPAGNQGDQSFPDAVGEELLNAIGSGMKFTMDSRPGTFQFIPGNPDGDKTDAIYQNGGFYAECNLGSEYLVLYSQEDGFKWNTEIHNKHLHLVPPPPDPEEPAPEQ